MRAAVAVAATGSTLRSTRSRGIATGGIRGPAGSRPNAGSVSATNRFSLIPTAPEIDAVMLRLK